MVLGALLAVGRRGADADGAYVAVLPEVGVDAVRHADHQEEDREPPENGSTELAPLPVSEFLFDGLEGVGGHYGVAPNTIMATAEATTEMEPTTKAFVKRSTVFRVSSFSLRTTASICFTSSRSSFCSLSWSSTLSSNASYRGRKNERASAGLI